ncbi:tyrosine recombinase XerS, partial [Streptococcus suis]
KEYRRFFEWFQDSDLVAVERISDITLDGLEHLTKKDMEAFILYMRERPLQNANTTQNGVSQTTNNRTLSALTSHF